MARSCCGPSTCFTCDENPTAKDACMCGCGYLNGPLAIFVAQFFTFMGGLLSLATIIDCSFATITDRYTFDFQNGLEIESQGVGFIFFEKSDGHCYWYDDFGGVLQRKSSTDLLEYFGGQVESCHGSYMVLRCVFVVLFLVFNFLLLFVSNQMLPIPERIRTSRCFDHLSGVHLYGIRFRLLQ